MDISVFMYIELVDLLFLPRKLKDNKFWFVDFHIDTIVSL